MNNGSVKLQAKCFCVDCEEDGTRLVRFADFGKIDWVLYCRDHAKNVRSLKQKPLKGSLRWTVKTATFEGKSKP
jgi:hypothetical protein